MELTERDKVALKEYLGYIRMGSKTLIDVDTSRYREELVKMMQEDVDAGRSTGHERKALREYNKSIGKE